MDSRGPLDFEIGVIEFVGAKGGEDGGVFGVMGVDANQELNTFGSAELLNEGSNHLTSFRMDADVVGRDSDVGELVGDRGDVGLELVAVGVG